MSNDHQKIEKATELRKTHQQKFDNILSNALADRGLIDDLPAGAIPVYEGNYAYMKPINVPRKNWASTGYIPNKPFKTCIETFVIHEFGWDKFEGLLKDVLDFFTKKSGRPSIICVRDNLNVLHSPRIGVEYVDDTEFVFYCEIGIARCKDA